jgi:hypothetical protein
MPNDTAAVQRPHGAWGVKDTNARQRMPDGTFIPRVHEIMTANGAIVSYPLRMEPETYMPEAHARQFLKDEAFIVTNALGQVMKPLSEEQQERVPPPRLSPGHVIAAWEELTTDALLTRAGTLSGFDNLPPEPDRSMLIDFLTGRMQQLEPGDGDDDTILGEERGGTEIANALLGGE